MCQFIRQKTNAAEAADIEVHYLPSDQVGSCANTYPQACLCAAGDEKLTDDDMFEK
jgi:hypothetical protein